jgi:hypothetical protein|tara:strand:+ start:421 stop:741 length:321 start_codon:yes stop_codon:yes gene_type:complete
MRVHNLLDTVSSDNVSPSAVKLQDKYSQGDGPGITGVAVFKISASTATLTVFGSTDGANFYTIKSVTASDMTNDMAAFTIALAPHMKATATSVGTNTVMKVDIISD